MWHMCRVSNINYLIFTCGTNAIHFFHFMLFLRVMSRRNDQERIEAIAGRIKSLRIEAGYRSYEHFAVENDLDPKQYFRIEKGTNLTLKSLFRVVNILEISLSDFFKPIQ